MRSVASINHSCCITGRDFSDVVILYTLSETTIKTEPVFDPGT
jgi:hypothetical protein